MSEPCGWAWRRYQMKCIPEINELSVPSLPLAGVTTRNFHSSRFLKLGSCPRNTRNRQPIAVFDFYCPRCKQAGREVHSMGISMYSLMPGLFHQSWLNSCHLTIFPWPQILLPRVKQILSCCLTRKSCNLQAFSKDGNKGFSWSENENLVLECQQILRAIIMVSQWRVMFGKRVWIGQTFSF